MDSFNVAHYNDFDPLTHYHLSTAQQRMQRHREDEVH